DGFEKEVIVGFDIMHQMSIAGDQNDKDALAWVSGLIRMLNDVEQIIGFDGNHHGLEGNASLKLKDLVLTCAPAKGLHGSTLRPCVPIVISHGGWGLGRHGHARNRIGCSRLAGGFTMGR
ncbi:MAG: hypothetical protein ACKOZT_12075, partial [Cyanobium sp.]